MHLGLEPVTRYSKFGERSEQQIWETSRKWDKFRFLWVELYVGTAHSQKAKSAKITLNTTFKVIFYKCYFSYQYGKSKPLPYDFNLWYLSTARFSHFIDSLRNSPVDCFVVSLFLMRARHIVFLCHSDILARTCDKILQIWRRNGAVNLKPRVSCASHNSLLFPKKAFAFRGPPIEISCL